MAKASTKGRGVSSRPSKQEKGQAIGIPVGAVCKVTELSATTWEEAGEKAIKGGRSADDPALKITVEIKGVDEPVTEFLGCGKGGRLQPSRDGEFFEPANPDIQIDGLPESSNTGWFLTSVFDKKRHGKLTPAEELLDGGFSSLVGMVFRAGKEVVPREGLQVEAGGRAPRPTLIVAEMLELPGTKGKKRAKVEEVDEEEEDDDADDDDDEEEEAPKKRGSGKKRPVKDEDEEEEEDDDEDEDEDEDEEPEEKPRGKAAGGGRGKRSSKRSSTGAAEVDHAGHRDEAEKAVIAALELPKYRKGIPLEKVFSAVFTMVRDHPSGPGAAKKIASVVDPEEGGDGWVKDADRPWQVVEKKIDGEEVEVIVPV